MITKEQQEASKEVLMKYLLPDCLKPEYDGMNASELARKVIEASQSKEQEEILNNLL